MTFKTLKKSTGLSLNSTREINFIFMAKLVLHVGPGKCGSSSIQQFFLTQKNPCIQKICYSLLNPLDISKINCIAPNKAILATLSKQLSEKIIHCDTLILSHEFLFQNPYAIKNICSLAKNQVAQISIIGYSRRQSDFLISAYSQWLFRSQDRVNETTNVLDKLKLDPILFTGLERQIIASIKNDFYSARQLSGYSILDWYNSYNNISQLIYEPNILIKCGTLPNKETDTPLIQDFCNKSELTLRSTIRSAPQKSANLSFNQDIIEAINNAVALDYIEISGSHNKVINLLSSQMPPTIKDTSQFLLDLKAYVDTYYLVSNKQLCQQYDLNETYFSPSYHFSKPEILEIIAKEGYQRSLNKSAIIKNYQALSAKVIKLCLKLATDA